MSEKIDELVKLAASLDESSPMNDVEKFIVDLNIQAGNGSPKERTQSRLIYWAYLKWCKKLNIKALSRIKFFMLFAKYFKVKPMRYHRVYFVLPEPFKVDKEEDRRASMHLRDEREAFKLSRMNREKVKKRWAKEKLRKKQEKEAKRKIQG